MRRKLIFTTAWSWSISPFFTKIQKVRSVLNSSEQAGFKANLLLEFSEDWWRNEPKTKVSNEPKTKFSRDMLYKHPKTWFCYDLQLLMLNAGWLAGFLTCWLAGWLCDVLAGWLTDWLTGLLTGWLADWLASWLANWLVDWLADWLFDWQDD